MNPLTLVKRIQNINAKEASLGISEDASWHAKYRDSAYVFVGGVPFNLTEGDLLAVFAQYGEIVDVNLVRDKGTGKSKGFAFVAYEDQRSTNLAVDNLNGAQVVGRTIRVDHVTKYKKKEEEDEETAQQKREEKGVCRELQKGNCTRGDGCKFSHNEQRAANTGWGEKDKDEKWGHDKYGGAKNDDRRPGNGSRSVREGDRDSRSKGQAVETLEREARQSNTRAEKRFGNNGDEYDKKAARGRDNRDVRSPRGHDRHDHQPKSTKHDEEILPKLRGSERREERRSTRHDREKGEDVDRREESRSTRHDREKGEDVDRREGKRSRRGDDRGYEQRSRNRRYDRDALEPRAIDNRRNEERARSRDDDERSGDRRHRA